MTNLERWIKRFIKQYPQYKEMEGTLTMNIFGDVMVPEGDNKNRIIAISDCNHSLANMNIYEEPTKWSLKE